jgi:hypothetical protein
MKVDVMADRRSIDERRLIYDRRRGDRRAILSRRIVPDRRTMEERRSSAWLGLEGPLT